MERQKIFPVLFAVLLAAAVFLGVYFFVMYRSINYLPDEALSNLCEILEGDKIFLDPVIVPLKKELGTVYVSAPEEYGETAAVRLGQSGVKYRFAVPDGEMILLENGILCEFRSDFYFRCRKNGDREHTANDFGEEAFVLMNPIHPDEAERECEAAKDFLSRGSSGFDMEEQLKLATEVSRVGEKDGVYYVECIRTIDGDVLKGHRAVCAVSNGGVIEAEGNWCFLSADESHSSQLTDIFNILFSVKKEIDGIRESENAEDVRITAIEQCYTMYYLGGNGGLCFVPCWRIVTDVCGDFVYNAVDGKLCTG